MYKRKLFIQTDNDWVSIQQIMEEQGIPYYSHKFTDSSLPVLEENRKEIVVSFPESYSQAFFKAVDEELQTEIFQEEQAAKSFKPGKALLIIYSVIMSLLFARYFHMNHLNSSSKYFTYSWNYRNTEQTAQHNTHKGIKTVFVDKNYDLNYERISTYVKGKKASMFFDDDENGMAEKYEEYARSGALSTESYDANQDGNFESWIIYLENGKTLKILDTDDDGSYDILDQFEGKK